MSENIDKPYVLYVAEIIYLEIFNIKKNNNINNIEAFERFIGSETYKKISSGKFHDEWLNNLKKNNNSISLYADKAYDNNYCNQILKDYKLKNCIIKKNNINICLESYLLKFINIISVFCKADNFKKQMLDSESNYENNIFTILINELCNNQIQSWDIYYNLVLNEIIINKSKQDDKKTKKSKKKPFAF